MCDSVCMCLCVCVHMCIPVPTEARKGPGTRVTGGGEQPGMNTGNQA